MADYPIERADLARLDRDVGRAFVAWTRWRAALAKDPEERADVDPIEPFRWVAGQTTYVELGGLEPVETEVPLRDALKRWSYALLQRRLSRDLEVAWARSAVEARGIFAGDGRRRVGYVDSWRGVVAAKSREEARRHLDAAAECAPPLAAIARERAARRVEVAARLGIDDPSAPAVDVPLAELRRCATELLAQTEDLAAQLHRATTPQNARPDPVDAIGAAMARDATEGWPSRLTHRWLEELFGDGARGLTIELPPLPAPLGAASFARALREFGFAFRVACSVRAPRFALARDPWFVAAHRFATLFGSLASSDPFQRVALCLGRRDAANQSRALARTALLDARFGAMRLLLGDERDFAPRDRFEELGSRVFGAPLPIELAGAWPAGRDDEPARFLALMTTLPLARALVDRFDTDWFQNPRTFPHLRGLGAGPAREQDTLFDASGAASAMARAFERALG
jgi:hypothetical protein